MDELIDTIFKEFESAKWNDNADRDIAEDILLKHDCAQPKNKPTVSNSIPLSLEELRQMVSLWVWIESNTWDGKHYSGWGKIIQSFPIVSAKIIEENPGYITEYDIAKHGAKFYAHKPEQEAEK